jgi:2,3-bisphosphoglycerate-dependent phosphoglycerate mutase
MSKKHDQKTEFWLVRHGQTDWNVEGRFQGQAEMPLNETGEDQVKELAQKLRKTNFHGIYSSDLKRALDTARYLANGNHVQIDRRLREVNQGEWEGMLYGSIKDLYPAHMQKRREDPLNARPPGGESLAELADRVWPEY